MLWYDGQTLNLLGVNIQFHIQSHSRLYSVFIWNKAVYNLTVRQAVLLMFHLCPLLRMTYQCNIPFHYNHSSGSFHITSGWNTVPHSRQRHIVFSMARTRSTAYYTHRLCKIRHELYLHVTLCLVVTLVCQTHQYSHGGTRRSTG